jgi:hypothetical protein
MNSLTSSSVDNATIAAYYLYGLEAGMLSPQQVKDWAFSIIESNKHPPAEIIGIGMSGGLPELIENLNAVPGKRDVQLAGRWLLCVLRGELAINPAMGSRIAKQAMQVARSTDLPDELYTFDSIDDMFSLAETKTYGTMEQCHEELARALAKYQVDVSSVTQSSVG